MPFRSEAQRRKCYARKAAGDRGWNCSQWSNDTKGSLPYHVGDAKTRCQKTTKSGTMCKRKCHGKYCYQHK